MSEALSLIYFYVSFGYANFCIKVTVND